jgi:type IV fimbrial biogenesis protein FimT
MVFNYSNIVGKMGMIMVISRGFTLIELLVTLSVASILLAMAVPSYRVFVQDSLILTQSNSFSSAMMLAKSEAVKRSSPVTICSSTDGLSCNGGNVWSGGWLVFADTDGDGAVDPNEIIQVSAALSGGNTLSGGRNRVTYAASGYTIGFADTFSLCDSRGAAVSRGIILNNQGRLRTVTGGGTCS